MLRLFWCLLFVTSLGCTDSKSVDVNDAMPPDGGLMDAGQFDVCEFPQECPGGDCILGECIYAQPSPCGDGQTCPEGEVCSQELEYFCASECEIDRTCPLRPRPCSGVYCPRAMTCIDGLCVNECVTDQDCGRGHCQRGICIPMPEVFSDVLGGPVGTPGTVFAGASVVPFKFPVGVSMAGFINRVGASTPYAKALGGSDRVLERQDVRVLTISTDKELVIFLRVPLAWSTDYMRSLTAIKLQNLTRSEAHPNGVNYLESLVMVATHSHSQPARFWHLVPELGLGAFGFGAFSKSLVEIYTDVFADAVYESLNNMGPARVGWSVLDDIDPEEHIHANRRPMGPPIIDDRLLLLRVDDPSGTPLAGLVSFGIHGTHMNDTWITGDVAAGIERIASAKFTERSGRPVPILFANGNAGNISPTGDDVSSADHAQVQIVGHRLYPFIERAWAQAQPRADVDLELVTRRVPVTYELLGYDRDAREFRDNQGDPYIYGGYYCLDTDPPAGGFQDGALNCRASADLLGWPIPNVHKAVLSAIRLDGLFLTTLPGEPTSSLGLRLGDWVEMDARAAGWPDARSYNLGYSQSHHLYLLDGNDWWQGGYEASNNWFGWKLGGYFIRASRRLAQQLLTPDVESNETGIKPMLWPDLEDDEVSPTQSIVEYGTVYEQPESRIQRGGLVSISWEGGHPAVDLPRVSVQIQRADSWASVGAIRGQPLDDSGFGSLLTYVGDYGEQHGWRFQLEIPFELPVGDYRLLVDGASRSNGETIAYQIASGPFEVEPASLRLSMRVQPESGHQLLVNYPHGPTNDTGANAFEELKAKGTNWRHGLAPIEASARAYSFILGGRLEDGLIQLRCTRVDGGLYSQDDLEPVPGTTPLRLVTARDESGEEQITDIPVWLTSVVDMPPGGSFQDCSVIDEYGNNGTIRIEP